MKNVNVMPSNRTPRKLEVPEIWLFRYTPKLQQELEKGIITREEAVTLFRAMVLHRNLEYMVRDLDVKRFVPYEGYEYRGTSHLSVGQEAAAVGAMSVLKREDYITSTHRGHGHCLNKGFFALLQMDEAGLKGFLKGAQENEFPVDEYKDLREAAIDYHVYRTVAELLGKQAGYCKGRGGGMHIADFSVGNLGANAIVGGSMAIGTGAALAVDRLGEERVVVCCVGDGAMNNGIAHESMNFSTLGQFKHGLPIIFFVENNQYGYTGQQKVEVTDVEFLSQRGLGYNAEGMHAETICGMNVLSVRDALRRAKALCLKGEGPVLIEAETYRHWGHNFKDKGTAYRTQEEKDAWMKYDPVDWFRAQLLESGIMTEADTAAEWDSARAKVETATMRAVKGRDPDPKDMLDGLWSPTTSNGIGDTLQDRHAPQGGEEHPARQRRQDHGAPRGRGGTDRGDDPGPARRASGARTWRSRVGPTSPPPASWRSSGASGYSTRRSPSPAICGTGVGASMVGLRPVVELMYIDFVLQAMDQIGNQAAKARYMFGGQYSIPLVIRATIGGGKGYAGQHSQSLESVPAHFPGIKVIAPSNAYDMKGLLKSAIRDDNPVFFIEHQWVYLEKSVVPTEEYTVPIGVGKVVREGTDMTVVCYSNMVPRVTAAAQKLKEEDGISIEVVDPRTLVPLDIELISRSVQKTGRALIVVQAVYTGGYASHISHEITRTSFSTLQAPVRILSAYDVPPPMSYPLEVENIPSVEKIVRVVKEELKNKGAARRQGR